MAAASSEVAEAVVRGVDGIDGLGDASVLLLSRGRKFGVKTPWRWTSRSSDGLARREFGEAGLFLVVLSSSVWSGNGGESSAVLATILDFASRSAVVAAAAIGPTEGNETRSASSSSEPKAGYCDNEAARPWRTWVESSSGMFSSRSREYLVNSAAMSRR
ncbi:hypothetical protein HYQ46_004430 [Verticillium longisporum]|nr:hypothetical protein HYQ46_004430 [Verticillium longisporum]